MSDSILFSNLSSTIADGYAKITTSYVDWELDGSASTYISKSLQLDTSYSLACIVPQGYYYYSSSFVYMVTPANTVMVSPSDMSSGSIKIPIAITRYSSGSTSDYIGYYMFYSGYFGITANEDKTNYYDRYFNGIITIFYYS